MTRRVVVTGIGVTSAFGVGRQALVEGLESDRSAFSELPGLLGTVPPGRGGQLDLPRKEFRNYFDPRVLRLSTMTRQTTLGCIACGALLADAGCPTEPGVEHPDKGAYLGSFIVPPAFSKQMTSARLLSHRPDAADTGFVLDDAGLALAMKKASAFDFLRALPNMPSSHLSIQTGFQGPACTYLGSDASGMQALVMAVGAIRSGLADTMVAGGAFCPFQEVHLSWQSQRGMWTSSDAVEPYAARRSGTLPGEGSALLYFETAESAEARGATVLAEVIGYGQRTAVPGTDDLDIRVETLRAALPEGTPDWIGPTAMGHQSLDGLEARAYVAAFGRDALERTGGVTAVPQIGFTGPASGPINLAAALLAGLGELSPVRSDVDAGTDADCQTLAATLGRSGKTSDGAVVLASSFSLDGVHAALALRAGGVA